MEPNWTVSYITGNISHAKNSAQASDEIDRGIEEKLYLIASKSVSIDIKASQLIALLKS